MTRKRRRFTAEFKKRVALEALRERDTVQAIAGAQAGGGGNRLGGAGALSAAKKCGEGWAQWTRRGGGNRGHHNCPLPRVCPTEGGRWGGGGLPASHCAQQIINP